MSGESHGQRSLVGCSPWGHQESGTAEVTDPHSLPTYSIAFFLCVSWDFQLGICGSSLLGKVAVLLCLGLSWFYHWKFLVPRKPLTSRTIRVFGLPGNDFSNAAWSSLPPLQPAPIRSQHRSLTSNLYRDCSCLWNSI